MGDKRRFVLNGYIWSIFPPSGRDETTLLWFGSTLQRDEQYDVPKRAANRIRHVRVVVNSDVMSRAVSSYSPLLIQKDAHLAITADFREHQTNQASIYDAVEIMPYSAELDFTDKPEDWL
jgi:hypothetical protein